MNVENRSSAQEAGAILPINLGRFSLVRRQPVGGGSSGLTTSATVFFSNLRSRFSSCFSFSLDPSDAFHIGN